MAKKLRQYKKHEGLGIGTPCGTIIARGSVDVSAAKRAEWAHEFSAPPRVPDEIMGEWVDARGKRLSIAVDGEGRKMMM